MTLTHLDSTSESPLFRMTMNVDNEQQQRLLRPLEARDGSTLNSYGSTVSEEEGFLHDAVEDKPKSIGRLGSIAIAVNSLAGPAILQLPFQYQASGLIPTTVCLILVAILSTTVCLCMTNTIQTVPHNHKFQHAVEFSDIFKIFSGKTAYRVTQVLFYLCTVCLNVAAIVDTAEVVDSVLGLHVSSYALSVDKGLEVQSWQHGPCTRKQVKLGYCQPFADENVYGDYLLTAGYVITAAVFLPVCLMDLKENTNWQIFGFFVLMTLSLYFCYEFGHYQGEGSGGPLQHVTVWGTEWSDLLGVILFNFSLVLAIPAWLHEKREHVSVRKVVVQSTVIATSLYVAVGALGAMAMAHVNVNMLNPMLTGAYGTGLQVTGSVFAFFIIGLDIPLFSVLTRYNLTHSGMCSPFMANLLVVWIPWGISWVFYQGDAVGQLLAWGGVLLTSAVAFLLPLWISLEAVKKATEYSKRRDRRIRRIRLLLFVTAGAVVAAIAGQYLSSEEYEAYIHSAAYLNGTSTLNAPVSAVTPVVVKKNATSETTTHKQHKHLSAMGNHLDHIVSKKKQEKQQGNISSGLTYAAVPNATAKHHHGSNNSSSIVSGTAETEGNNNALVGRFNESTFVEDNTTFVVQEHNDTVVEDYYD